MSTPRRDYERPAFTGRRRGPSLITIPKGVGPHTRLVFEEMRRQGVTYDRMEEGSGVRRAALKAWRHKNRPSLESIEAALGFLGFDLIPIPRAKLLDAEIVAQAKPLADRLGLTMPETVQALVEIVLGLHERFAAATETPSPRTGDRAKL